MQDIVSTYYHLREMEEKRIRYTYMFRHVANKKIKANHLKYNVKQLHQRQKKKYEIYCHTITHYYQKYTSESYEIKVLTSDIQK